MSEHRTGSFITDIQHKAVKYQELHVYYKILITEHCVICKTKYFFHSVHFRERYLFFIAEIFDLIGNFLLLFLL